MERKETNALRYLGIDQKAWPDFEKEIQAGFRQIEKLPFTFRIWKSPITFLDQGIRIDRYDLMLTGSMARRLLKECHEIWIIACSLGFGFESELKRLSLTDMRKSLVYDACGSAWVEEAMEKKLEEQKTEAEGISFTPCFSCGYGDLPLELQKTLFDRLSITRNCHIYLSDSYMMNPTKSITAFVGLKNDKSQTVLESCDECVLNTKCQLKKEGKKCNEPF